MGKRKERRLAALSNAGRRVKLDLFAEPSGDLGGSSVNGEGGGDIDPTQRAGLRNSPSSSVLSRNPLLLLEQYSDDELDEETNGRSSHVVAEDSPSDHVDQEGPPFEEKEEDPNAVEVHSAQKVELQDVERDSTPVDVPLNVEVSDSGESNAAVSADKCKEIDSMKQISIAGTSDAQVIGDVSLGWRIVMHEESNQYYYWNTETGETSWEVPDVLAQSTLSISNQNVPSTKNVETIPVNMNESSSTLGIGLNNSSSALAVDGSISASLIHEGREVHSNRPQTNEGVEGCQSESLKDKNCADVYQNELQNNLSESNLPLGCAIVDNELEEGVDLLTGLMRQCECLMERLKSLKRYRQHLQCRDRIRKYILELDIRLSDIKSLSSYGSTLLPFWIHSQRQLKQLEDVINNEIYHLAVSAQMNDDVGETTDTSFKEKEKSWGNEGHDSDANGCENNGKSEVTNAATNIENDSFNPSNENVYAGHVSSLGSPNEHMEASIVVSEKVNETAYLESEFHPGEDDDMDVDMEVEDGILASTTVLGDSSAKSFTTAKQLGQPNTPAEYQTLAPVDESIIPPLPEEDWIPPPPPDSDQIRPPPPDNEQVPPPPPDDPTESSYPPLPSYVETSQTILYTEQYNLSYTDSNFQYYGHSVTVPSGNLYGHADGSQVGVAHASLYYETVANTYTETVPIIVGPMEPVAYYNLQNGLLPSVPVASGAESSILHTESGPMSYDAYASDHIRTVDDPAEAVPNLKHDVSAMTGEMITSFIGVTSTSTTTETPATIDANGNISAPLTNVVPSAASVPATTTAAKVQSKVPRSKKRTVAVASSLRSNKKVSNLVDKWKAAKEELNDNDDDPENPYEILEKKKQQEIEEWHAKQIASGEAKDNANFQSLGGDWRERVKRRRAQAAKEAAQTPSEAPFEGNREPDLAELSKGLPSGWQAYWDEASKQVYYGNVLTSETSWSKPAK